MNKDEKLSQNSSYELSYITPGIDKVHTNFVLPEINIDHSWGNNGIYFLQDRDGYIKIGQSNNIPKRITQYKTHNAVMRLVGVISCAPGVYQTYNENLLHRLWSEFVVTGEWFSPVRPLIRYISAFEDGYGCPLEIFTFVNPEGNNYYGEPNTYTELINHQEMMKGAR
jgi:hypothetical protein